MENENETKPEVEETEEETKTEGDVNWEERAKKLEAKATANREKRKEEKANYEKQIADLKAKDTSQDKAQPDFELLQKTYLRAAGISAEDEVELALTTSKKWDMALDKLADDEDFKIKLENLRQKKANATATADIKGESGSKTEGGPKDYLDGRALPEKSPANRKLRANIAREMVKKEGKGAIRFYNDK